MIRVIRGLIRDRRGATAIEYGLILGLIVVGIMISISTVGGKTGGMWSNMANKVSAVETF